MCLLLKKNAKKQTAKKDIKCYKVLKVRTAYRDGKEVYERICTPYRKSRVYLGELNEIETYPNSKPLTTHEFTDVTDDSSETYVKQITGGAFHLFQDKKTAILEAKDWGFDFITHEGTLTIHNKTIVVEAIIPEGAQYYKGVCEFTIYGMELEQPKAICTDKVIYGTEIVFEVGPK